MTADFDFAQSAETKYFRSLSGVEGSVTFTWVSSVF